MSTLKKCHKCRYFLGITRYRPDSIGVLHYNMAAGWYVQCGDENEYTDILIPDAVNVVGMPCENYQVFKRFLHFNENHRLECPRCRHKHGKPQPAEPAGQLILIY